MVYAAFIKGINVGGKNIVKMDDLKSLFFDLGYREIKTYIQSGNIVFSCSRKKNVIAKDIQESMKQRFDISSNVILRSAEEMKNAVEGCPFTGFDQTESIDESRLYLGMTHDGFVGKDRAAIEKLRKPGDRYKIIGPDIYLLLSESFGTSRLAKGLASLDAPVTVRNWKTVNKVYQMVMPSG